MDDVFPKNPAPLVSVILPVFNAAPYLSTAVESILRQTYENLEILLIDDGSEDGSGDIVRALARKDDRIRAISRENRGLIETLNEGLDLAKGALVARMDADDIAHPDRLHRQVAAFTANPRLGMCGTGYNLAKVGRVLKRTSDPMFETCDLPTLAVFFTVFLHPTVMFNREVLGDALWYDATYPFAEDFDLLSRIARHHPCAFIKDSLLIYRLHEQSVSTRHRDQMRNTHLRIVAKNLRAQVFLGDVDALDDLACDQSEAVVRRVGLLWHDLGRQVDRRERDLRSSYDAGRTNLFYFLYALLTDLNQPKLIACFLDAAQGWRMIRRREAAALRLERFFPGALSSTLAAGRVVERQSFYVRSKAISLEKGGTGAWSA